MAQVKKQNVTLSLDKQTILKIKILAVKRSTSISGLLADEVRKLVEADERYEQAAASAIARMKQGFHLGGGPKVSREELHER